MHSFHRPVNNLKNIISILLDSPAVQPQAKQWVGNGVGVFGAGDEVEFEKFQSCGLC